MVGSIITSLIRLRGATLPGATILPRQIAIKLTFQRITLAGMSLLGASVVYYASGGVTPITEHNFALIPTLMGLIFGFILTQVIGVFLSEKPKPSVVWSAGERHRLMNEILLLITVAPFAIIYHAQGVVVFSLLMGLVAAQAIRHWQIQRTQRSLLQRVDELSILNDMAQSIAASLELADVLKGIYTTLAKASPIPLFYVALYEDEQRLLEFPLVIANGQAQVWDTSPITHYPLVAQIIQTHIHQHLTAPESIHALAHPNLPANHCAFWAYLCV